MVFLRDIKRGKVALRSSSTATPYSSRAWCPDRYSAVSRKVLLGRVPVCTAAPPGSGSHSMMATRFLK